MCSMCYNSGELVHPRNKLCAEIDLSSLPRYFYNSYTYYLKEDVEDLIAREGSEEDEWIQSPKYGHCTSRERRAVMQSFCKKHKLDANIAMLFDDVELFIDYGLITTDTDEQYFEAVREFAVSG